MVPDPRCGIDSGYPSPGCSCGTEKPHSNAPGRRFRTMTRDIHWRSGVGWLAFILVLTALTAQAHSWGRAKDIQSGARVDLTLEERAWLDQNPEKLTLYFNTEFPPIEFLSTSGIFTGMAADIIARIEELLGVAFYKKASDDWSAHLDALKSGACAIAPTIVRTAEREPYSFFSVPYAAVPVVIITSQAIPGRLSLENLSGLRIGVVSGYATEKFLRDKALYGHFEVVPVTNVPEGLQMVSFGQIDALAENLAVAAYYIDKRGIPNLRVAGTTDYVFSWSIGVSRQYPLLYSSIQKALDRIPESELADIRKNWISLETDFGMHPETLQWLKLAALFAFLLLVGLAGITVILKERLRQKVDGLRESETKLRMSEQRYRLLIEQIDEALLVIQDGMVKFVNSKAVDAFGYAEQDLLCKPIFDLIHPEDQKVAMKHYLQKIDSDATPTRYTCRAFSKSRQTHWVEISSVVIEWEGRPAALNLIADITDRRKAEKEREKLMTQLSQAQKMESIGRLAGGVAHDFNNMIGVILGHTELALGYVDTTHPLHGDLVEIRKAAERSTDLTRQLLAFARKQTIAPKVLDLNETVEGMLKMLRRLIGENIDLAWLPGKNRCLVKMDPSQIDQILANLSVNARDAISGVGKVTIETGAASFDENFDDAPTGALVGEYVVLTFSDNGRGMAQETLDNLFEPFFTTKAVGKGTGLGLATVYGIVKQNGGHIDVYSEPEKGSTFRIYLPRHTAEAAPESRDAHSEPVAGGHETILVVEDEPMILDITRTILKLQGYNVLSAATPAEAIRLAGEHAGGLDLLVTDVIMPEMNGRELADILLSLRPGLRCLFMSGYTADVIAHHGVLDEGVSFIQKPFYRRTLSEKVRQALDAKAHGKLA